MVDVCVMNLLGNVFSIDVAVWQFVLSQVFGFFALCGYFVSMQQKSNDKLILWNAFGGVFYLGMALALEAWIVASVVAVGLVRLITFYYFEKSGGRVPLYIRLSLLVVFLAATVIGVVFTWSDWWDWIMMVSFLVIIFAQFFGWTHVTRLGHVVAHGVLLAIALSFMNIAGMIIDAMVLLSIIIFYVRFFCNRGKRAVCDEEESIDCDKSDMVDGCDDESVTAM